MSIDAHIDLQSVIQDPSSSISQIYVSLILPSRPLVNPSSMNTRKYKILIFPINRVFPQHHAKSIQSLPKRPKPTIYHKTSITSTTLLPITLPPSHPHPQQAYDEPSPPPHRASPAPRPQHSAPPSTTACLPESEYSAHTMVNPPAVGPETPEPDHPG